MIEMAVAVALHCAPQKPSKPKPIQYTRQMRLKDSFALLEKQPTSSFIRLQTIYQKLNFGRELP